MLERIRIKNYLTCQDVTLDNLGGVTVLAGKNGTGKTNILKAIQWAAESAISTKRIYPPSTTQPTEVELHFTINKTQYIYTIKTRADLLIEITKNNSSHSRLEFSLDEKLECLLPRRKK